MKNAQPWSSTAVRLAALALITLLASPGLVGAQDPTAEQERFLEVMGKYLEFSSRYAEVVADSPSVLQLAVESITEYYKERGEGAKAIDHLRGLLEDTNDRVARNILRMKLSDLLSEYGRKAEALQEVDAIFRENTDG